MAEMKRLDQYLQRRGGRWHYIRRIPTRYRKLDPRDTILTALDTSSLQVARARRDAMVEADDQYWAHLAFQQGQKNEASLSRQRYEAARTRAKARGFLYTPLPELTTTIDVEDLLKRLSFAVKNESKEAEVEAVMGAVPPVSDTLRQAFDLYCDKLAVSELANKSPDQQKKWKAAKLRAIEHFILLCGNLTMDKITRDHARKFYEWWGGRIHPKSNGAQVNSKSYRPNSANRELGNLRKTFREYWSYQGEESWKAEREILQEIKRDMTAMKVTAIDHKIVRGVNPNTNVIDLRAGSAASTFDKDSSMNRHVLIGRMRHLKSVGLAEQIDTNCWRIDNDAFNSLQQIDQRHQLTGEIHASMTRANISRPIRLDDGREVGRPQRVIGRVIGKTLGQDEGMQPDPKGGSKVRFIIDGSDGYVRAVETRLDTRAGEAAKVGSIVEVGPPRLSKVDRSIRDIAQGTNHEGKENNGYVGVFEIDMSAYKPGRDPSDRQRAAHDRSHRLRLETLTKAGVVTALEHSPRDGRALAWQVPEDFESEAIALDLEQGRASGVTLLSVQDLNAQLASPGATWLDRAQIGWSKIERISSPQSAFRNKMKEAFRQRQNWLVERGHADVSREADGKNYVTYKRGYVKALEAEGFNAATQKIEAQTGKPFVAAQAGRLIEGTVSQKFELPHGPHAMIETQRAFYLVPWQSVHAQTWGKRIRGRVLSGGGIDWNAGRSRGIGR